MLDLKEEQNLFKLGYKYIGAIDEAGRGPLAGPVVAVCVILNKDFNFKFTSNDKLRLIKDSKRLSEKRREELFKVIFAEFHEVGIGVCEHTTIDRINILQASFLAMKKALGSLKQKPDFLILDGGFPIPNLSLKQKTIKRGDESILSIAAASIVAKVSRDRIMREMNELYPQYGFKQHKGYGTKFHFDRLFKYGPCPIHRKSFAPVKRLLAT
jgi:ribonuclease HII